MMYNKHENEDKNKTVSDAELALNDVANTNHGHNDDDDEMKFLLQQLLSILWWLRSDHSNNKDADTFAYIVLVSNKLLYF